VPEPWTTERPKVLVIADDQGAGELITRLLDRAGWTTDLAYSAASGLSELEDAHYSAIVLALASTAHSIDVLRSIRETPSTADLRVAVCGHSRSEQGEAWITGADAYLVHPFGSDELVTEVEAVVGRPDDERDDHRQRQVGLSIPDAPDE
jgi:two-component system alkaline phosphatase synthesis response regulator PhoP